MWSNCTIFEEWELPEGTQGNTCAEGNGKRDCGLWSHKHNYCTGAKSSGRKWNTQTGGRLGPGAPGKGLPTLSSEQQERGRLEDELRMTLNLGIISGGPRRMDWSSESSELGSYFLGLWNSNLKAFSISTEAYTLILPFAPWRKLLIKFIYRYILSNHFFPKLLEFNSNSNMETVVPIKVLILISDAHSTWRSPSIWPFCNPSSPAVLWAPLQCAQNPRLHQEHGAQRPRSPPHVVVSLSFPETWFPLLSNDRSRRSRGNTHAHVHTNTTEQPLSTQRSSPCAYGDGWTSSTCWSWDAAAGLWPSFLWSIEK